MTTIDLISVSNVQIVNGGKLEAPQPEYTVQWKSSPSYVSVDADLLVSLRDRGVIMLPENFLEKIEAGNPILVTVGGAAARQRAFDPIHFLLGCVKRHYAQCGLYPTIAATNTNGKVI